MLTSVVRNIVHIHTVRGQTQEGEARDWMADLISTLLREHHLGGSS